MFFCPHQLKKINVSQTFKGNRCRQTLTRRSTAARKNLMITRFPPNKNTIVFWKWAPSRKHKDEVWRRFVKVAWTVWRSAARYRLELCERSHLQKRVRAAVQRLHTLSPKCGENVWLSCTSTVNIVRGFDGQTYAYPPAPVLPALIKLKYIR